MTPAHGNGAPFSPFILSQPGGEPAGPTGVARKLRRRAGVVAFAAALGLASLVLGGAHPALAQDRAESAYARVAAVDARVAEFMAAKQVVGRVVVVVSRGELACVRGYGLADREAGIPTTCCSAR